MTGGQGMTNCEDNGQARGAVATTQKSRYQNDTCVSPKTLN